MHWSSLFVLVWLLQGGWKRSPGWETLFKSVGRGAGRESEVMVASDEGSERHKGPLGPSRI